MSEDESDTEDDYEIEDFTSKENVIRYIEHQGEDVTAPQVLGHFMMHPSLEEDVNMLIDLTYN